MKPFVLPVVLLVVGAGAGIGAGLFLFPPKTPEATEEATALGPCGPEEAEAEPDHAADHDAYPPAFVPIDTQFIVPVVENGVRQATMLLSLSLEIPAEKRSAAEAAKPLFQAAFLQALFDHANAGGFSGAYTGTGPMERLRTDLMQAAERAQPGLVTAVLITDILRQEG